EYDDVMNRQRKQVYGRRNNALFGERLAVDLDNAFYTVAQSLAIAGKETGLYSDFKLAAIMNLGLDTSITEDVFHSSTENALTDLLYQETLQRYQQRKQQITATAYPIISNIRKEQGNHIENVSVPFTDGKKGVQFIVKLDAFIISNGRELFYALERTITLMLIDELWKEHLRAMDDLRQSVQTAVHEQKDPLVIYKMEAFNAFNTMSEKLNRELVSFLCHAGLPTEQETNIREGKTRKTDLSNVRNNKAEVDAAGQEYGANEKDYFDPSGPSKQEPIRVEPKTGRNDPCPCGSGKKFKQCHGKDA
ncbi:MAG: SEC-C metal-binding domain-containing protein, partial [Ferruginibacter sp.]